MKFCENPLCQWHLECEPTCSQLKYILDRGPHFGETREVRRLRVRDSATRALHNFCEVCANAVAIANEQPKNEKRENEQGGIPGGGTSGQV